MSLSSYGQRLLWFVVISDRFAQTSLSLPVQKIIYSMRFSRQRNVWKSEWKHTSRLVHCVRLFLCCRLTKLNAQALFNKLESIVLDYVREIRKQVLERFHTCSKTSHDVQLFISFLLDEYNLFIQAATHVSTILSHLVRHREHQAKIVYVLFSRRNITWDHFIWLGYSTINTCTKSWFTWIERFITRWLRWSIFCSRPTMTMKIILLPNTHNYWTVFSPSTKKCPKSPVSTKMLKPRWSPPPSTLKLTMDIPWRAMRNPMNHANAKKSKDPSNANHQYWKTWPTGEPPSVCTNRRFSVLVVGDQLSVDGVFRQERGKEERMTFQHEHDLSKVFVSSFDF